MALLRRYWEGNLVTRFDGLFDQKRRSPQLPNTEQTEPPNIQTSKYSDAQASKHSDAQTSKLAKSKDPNYQRSTVYLPKGLHQRLKMAALQDGREISDIVEEMVDEWIKLRDT